MTSFGFFLKDQEFVSKTINDSSVNLDTFLANKVRQLSKRMEASKATSRHIKQVTSDPKQLKSIRLDIKDQTSYQANIKERLSSQDHPFTSTIPMSNKCHHAKESFIPNKLIQAKIGVLSVVIPDMLKVSSVKPRSTSVSPITSMEISQACVFRNKYLSNHMHPKHLNYKMKSFTCKMTPYVVSHRNLPAAMNLFVYK